MNPIRPPFTRDTALAKVQAAEDAWNSRDPERVSLAYTTESEWRNRTEFLRGRDEIRAFLTRKWQKELDYRLKKELWWYRSYGNEMWEFDEAGLMARRYASINDAPIREDERRVRVPPTAPAATEVPR